MSDRLDELAAQIEAIAASQTEVGKHVLAETIHEQAERLALVFRSEGNEDEKRAVLQDITARFDQAAKMGASMGVDFEAEDAAPLLRGMQAIAEAILEGRPEPTDKELGLTPCFLATAVHGGGQAREVILLRRFRDQRLGSHRLGQWLIRGYDRVSPPLAKLVRRSRTVRTLVAFLVVRPATWLVDRWPERP